MDFKTFAIAAFTTVFVTTAAHAVTITATDASGATSSPFILANFGTSGTNGLVSAAPIVMSNAVITFSPNASNPQAGVYSGNVTNTAASAFLGTGLVASNYLVAEPNDPVNFAFSSAQTSFSLLWGTVDVYNSLNLSFTTGGTTTTTTITGTQVAAAVGGGFAIGSSPAFVTISGLGPFTNVSATSSTAAFEFVPAAQVPEPASIAILGAGLAGLGLIRRARARTQA